MRTDAAPEGRLIAAFAISIKTGLLFWFLVSFSSGNAEPWDSSNYFSLVYPLALLTSALLGAVFPTRAWLWGVLMMLSQVPVVAMVSGVGPLLLAGLAYAAALAVPAAGVSALAGYLRQRVS